MREKTTIGPGSASAIPEIIRKYVVGPGKKARTVIVVSDGFDTRPWAGAIRRLLADQSASWLVHRGPVVPASVAALAGGLREARADVVLAIGGGSVLDAAKASTWLSGISGIDAAAVVAACTGESQAPPAAAPVVAVPTTPGTGAEVTPFATVWEPERNRKLSLAALGLAPSAAILDPDLLRGLSAEQVCAGLLDTLCQGAEAAWSVRSTAESTSYGLAAVALVGSLLESLEPRQPGAAALLTLQLAGNLSGHAIARAGTSSCHALSYPLTLRAGLPHGHACGVTFGRMLRYNTGTGEEDCTDPRGGDRVRQVISRIIAALGAQDADEADTRVEAFLIRHGLATLDEVNCPLDVLARDALGYARIGDNPRALSHATLVSLLSRHYAGQETCA